MQLQITYIKFGSNINNINSKTEPGITNQECVSPGPTFPKHRHKRVTRHQGVPQPLSVITFLGSLQAFSIIVRMHYSAPKYGQNSVQMVTISLPFWGGCPYSIHTHRIAALKLGQNSPHGAKVQQEVAKCNTKHITLSQQSITSTRQFFHILSGGRN
jgi:hypothetical protein